MVFMFGHLTVHFGIVFMDPEAEKLKIGFLGGLKSHVTHPIVANFMTFMFAHLTIHFGMVFMDRNFQGAQNCGPTNP